MQLLPPDDSRRLRDILKACRVTRICLSLLFWLLAGCASLAQDTVFPLRAEAQRHYLQDGRGRPFLMTGDSAWSMITDLSLADADLYLDTRKRQGFNTILVSLIEHKFARNAPANFYQEAPFLGAAFEQPNDDYFKRVEIFIEAAARRNMLVLLCPAYLGAAAGAEGWYGEMSAAGDERLKAYGRYVGRRFARFTNIIWVQGGDYDPPDRALVNAVAEGIAEEAPDALQTVHANRDTVTNVFWDKAGWLRVDTVYTYGDVPAAILARHRSGPPRPFFLIESKYEGEHGVGESDIRLMAYGAVLSGAGGQLFGNNPIWHFSAAGLFDTSATWQQALSSPGARSMSALVNLFSQLEWWKLLPDQGVLLKTAKAGNGQAFAARDADRMFAVVYVRDMPGIALDFDFLAGGDMELRWYDPSNGSFQEDTVRFKEAGVQAVAVPLQANGSGSHDWVGVLTERQ
ncbi:DUF4038 domain-containing protein [Neorhizobium alkalisoli]|nr:DUF4038 domain-containing protein [Neorhizobium alkalisoli]